MGAAMSKLKPVDDNAFRVVRGHHLLREQPLARVLPLVALQLDHLPHLLILRDAAVGVDCGIVVCVYGGGARIE